MAIRSKLALFVDNYRCFAGKHRFPIWPLTLLVGENSSGKTALLGAFRQALRATADLLQNTSSVDFNDPPFELGSFNELSYRGGRGKQRDSFTIGLEIEPALPQPSEPTGPIALHFTFSEHHSTPRLALARLSDESGFYLSVDSSRPGSASLVVGNPQAKISVGLQSDTQLNFPALNLATYLCHLSASPRTRQPLKGRLFGLPVEHFHSSGRVQTLQSKLQLLAGLLQEVPKDANSLAPVRSQPRRIYDPSYRGSVVTGDNTPAEIARSAVFNPEVWKKQSEALSEFGAESGLFTSIRPRPLGHSRQNSGVNPFQILLRLQRQHHDANIADVGYGVSQVLPILHAILTRGYHLPLLIQQPEVHLHPKAQAALGSFLAKEAGIRPRQHLLVETHSDFIINRVRMSIRKGALKPALAGIHFLRPGKQGAQESVISFSEMGELLNVPNDYRRFFLAEEYRVLGFEPPCA